MTYAQKKLHLGNSVDYIDIYTPSLLQRIDRKETRSALGITQEKKLPFHGVDVWNAYELSWLNIKGKPEVAVAEIHIPCSSNFILESKSLKLYFGSFGQTNFNSRQEVIQTIESDVGVCVQSPVMVKLLEIPPSFAITAEFRGTLLDHLDVEVKEYVVNKELLVRESGAIQNDAVYTHLFKSNCPVTGQPDWASIFVTYRGNPLCKEGLLKYLISYRKHQGFHEACVEQIYCDIMECLKPEQLSIYARYTRRGGIDINPFRSNFEASPTNMRIFRQ